MKQVNTRVQIANAMMSHIDRNGKISVAQTDYGKVNE